MTGPNRAQPAAPPYAELHAHSNYSLLDGTSPPEDLAQHAATLGLHALAITDHDSVAGIVRFAAAAARKRSLHAIIGAELTLEPHNAHVVLLATGLDGYQNLCRLLTLAYQRGGKDQPAVPFDALADHSAGLIALSACAHGELPRALAQGGAAAAREVAARYRDAFGADGYFIELHRHHHQSDGPRNAGLWQVARALDLRCVATNNVHYHDAGRALLHDVVTCIRHRTTLAEAGTLLRGNHEHTLKSPAQMARLFARERAWAAETGNAALDPLQATLEVAGRCTFTLDQMRYAFPRPEIPRDETELSFLSRLVEMGKRRFYPRASAEVDTRIAHELDIIRQLDLAGYLLVFREIVEWSTQQGIAVSIRGSAAASALLYCLGLCPVDPLEHGLLFERFCSPERRELPDIDLDFAHERREEVIQHVYQKYGRTHAAMVCETQTYRWKSALRDVAKVLGLSAQRAQKLADEVEWAGSDPTTRLLAPPAAPAAPAAPAGDQAGGTGGATDVSDAGAEGEDGSRISGRLADLILSLARQLQNTPRHRSIHVGGLVISGLPLTNVAPVEPARMLGRTILPWDKDDLSLLAEAFGVNLVKLDLLALGMLSVIGRAFAHVYETTGEALSLHGFVYDPRCYDVLCAADTVGLFQVESRAQQSFLPRLRPRNLTETAISVGAIRPGPGAAGAGEAIVRRRQGKEAITYPAPGLEAALKETYGVLLWQEQAIQLAVVTAGYTPGEADQLRRAMTSKRSREYMEAACQELVERMLARGYTLETAERVRHTIVGFAGYGFPRSHAYAFAHLALISATLRLRYPAAYYCAMLNCQPMGFYAPHTLLWDAQRHGVKTLPVDITRSAWECTLEASAGNPPAVRLGLKEINGLGPTTQEVLKRERARGPFRSVADFVTRTRLDRESLERVAEVGALLSLRGTAGRRADVWQTGELAGLTEGHLPGLAEQVVEHAALAPMTSWEETAADYRGLGYSVDRHVVSYLRPKLKRLGALTAAELPRAKRGLWVKTGGLVIVRQRPETAGHILFLTLEDETGLMNGIVYPNVYERLRRVLRGEPLLLLEGPVQHQEGVTHVMVRRAWPLLAGEAATHVPSHDFH